jgi:NADH dehydrogenase
MADQVVVLGAGYAGTGALQRLEQRLDDAEFTWISETDHHLVLHESHRVIRDPAVREKVTIPVDELKQSDTRFVEDRVSRLDTENSQVVLEETQAVPYDYLLVAVGSQTAFYGIPGLEKHGHTLKSLEDALSIHEDVTAAATAATPADPAHVVVGGAGLSGIQSAGEIAALRDENDLPIDVTLVEGLDAVFPPGDPPLQNRLASMLAARDVEVMTGEFIGEVDEDTIYVGALEDETGYDTELEYDVLLWTGGITGQDALEDTDIETDERSNRIECEATFETSHDRIFAVGDTALVEQDDEPAPPTAQAAWDAADVAADNLARRMANQPLKSWTYRDKGTLISIGDDAVAHSVDSLPIETFGGLPAETLKKAVATRWIADVSSWGRAVRAWSDM